MADTLLGGIVINEILVDPNGALNYDTDGNGTADSTDEFIELKNVSGGPIDISGLQLWDSGVGNYFTFPPGTILEPGAHAMVITGISTGGSLPTGGPDDLFFSAGRGTALINNGGDNVVLLDPANDEYVIATFNGDPVDTPPATYPGFPATATQVGAGESFGNDTDGLSLQRTPDGSDTFTSDAPTPGTTNVCFAQGTFFQTPSGEILVEDLKAGDVMQTYDNGPQRVKWVYAKTWTVRQMRALVNLAPVVIAAGALGNGRPLRDLRVSQQHRILVSGPISERMFGEKEVMVAAKHLTVLAGISIDIPATPVTYFHVMMDHHEVLLADGLPTESLYLGAETIKAIPPEAIVEIEQLLGKTAAELTQMAQSPARLLVKGRRARTLIDRHLKNDKPFSPKMAA